MILLVGTLSVLSFVYIYSLVSFGSNSRTPEEQEMEDIEQIKWIQEYNEKKNKKLA